MKSIKTKLILSFSIVILIITMIVSTIALTTGYSSLKEKSETSLELLSQEGAKIVESRMSEVLSSLTIISKKTEIAQMGWEVDISVLKEELNKTDFVDIGFVLPNGYTYYTDGTVRLMSDRSYVQSALSGKAEISDVIISRVTRQPEIEVAVPVYYDTEVVGALVGRKEAVSLSEITQDIGYGEKGYSFMINGVGTVIAHPEQDKVIDRINPIHEAQADNTYSSLAKSLLTILQQEKGNTEFQYNSGSYFAAYATITGTDWRIIITADESEIMDSIPKMVNTILKAMGIVLLLSIGIVFVLDSRLTRPLREMTNQSKQLGNLDISKNVDNSYLQQKDEIGTLSRTFQILTDNLRTIIRELSESANQVSDTARTLTESTQHSAEASEDITRTVEEIAKGAYEQAKNTETGLLQASVLDQKMNKNHQLMLNLNTTIDQVLILVEGGLKEIDKLIRLTDDNKAATRRISEVVLEMKKSSGQIGEASKIITDMARETNLLSFNASIEAARAGEAGRGFAVVAAEIQNMADQSAKSTRIIDSIINKIQRDMTETIDSMNQMTSVSEDQQKSVAETILKYREISEAIKISEKAVGELNQSETEMVTANSEIKLMLQALSAIAEQNAAGTEQTVSTMEEQNASSQIIADVSDRMTQLAISLRETVSRFKLQ